MNHVKIIMIAISIFGLGCFTDPIEPTLKNDAERQDTTDTDATDSKKDLVQTECVPTCSNGQVCKIDGFVCVDCLGDTDCSNQVCNTDLNTCADCLDNTFCTDATSSKCSAGTCETCSMDTDCEHIDGLPRCDASTCKVACENDSHCGGKVCDVTTNTCTTEDPMTASQCEPCVSDTQCVPTHHCVPLGFGSPNPVPRGNYCLKISTAQNPCTKPYKTAFNRTSIGNIDEEYCAINEELTTCEAVLVATSDIDCKNGALDEGDDTKCTEDASICRSPSNGVWTCTYNCNNDRQCTDTCSAAMDGYCQ